DGDARTTLLLPAQQRVLVSIGLIVGNSVRSNGSDPVEYDAAHPRTPLVFDVRPVSARIRGHVDGFAPDELGSLAIGFALPGEADSLGLTRPDADGSFELARVGFGEGELYLVRDGADGLAEVLARVHLVVDRDLEGIVLGADPSSLPEQRAR